MPGLNLGRAQGVAEVVIDESRCIGCGLCVKVCRGVPLYMEERHVRVDQSRLYGCIGCGACVSVCPESAIQVSGRDLFPEDILPLPAVEERADFTSLSNLMLARRSTRDFLKREVEPEKIEQILAAASMSPMGIPPSEIGVKIFPGFDSVHELSGDLVNSARSSRWMYSPWMAALLRPFIGKETAQMMGIFVGPAIDVYMEKWQQGVDWFFYGAPLAFLFYAGPYSDPADAHVAATFAMLAAEALGLGTCMLGLPIYFIKYDKKLREKYGLPANIQNGVGLIAGYPEVQNHRALRRRLGTVSTFPAKE